MHVKIGQGKGNVDKRIKKTDDKYWKQNRQDLRVV